MVKVSQFTFAALLASLGLLAGCSSSDYSDIDKFMVQTREKPQGVIDPIPIFKPYKAFRYNAASKRSPFEVPVKVREIASLSLSSDVKPDPKRVKEQLEAYNLEGLSMVGTLERGGTLWALIDDGSGAVHQVLKGNHMGKNHGRIVAIYPDSVAVVEIIANGKDSWIERPRTLKLKDNS
ncbi:MAG: pilus assembly protein PilP [Gammaproteobacteria bacterium]|nr:pilus assembly protein PilP [Gammaproteobacteria bacterium]MBT8150848.1 pilus assembly protein PilP [Gammaproteobacteria bacterium]NND40335.1 pilus assembly protein PilP [Pseudomonadales bacterium]NNL11089.1 pilus assembly protein PilP [Pseudomonadales bacterium]RZV50588.1 MAG: pilus assembly protein PilP [Pseudomonadales bacterium]